MIITKYLLKEKATLPLLSSYDKLYTIQLKIWSFSNPKFQIFNLLKTQYLWKAMPIDTVKLFTTIKPTLLRATLFRGTLFASIGVLLLIVVTTFLPVENMMTWGVISLLIGGGLMVYGLIPYRRLNRMENEPSELVLVDDEYLQLIIFGKQQYTIPLSMVEKTEYIEKGNEYGIGIWFAQDSENKVIVHNQRLNMANSLKRSRQKYGCDLFIPYFGRRSYTRLALFNPNS